MKTIIFSFILAVSTLNLSFSQKTHLLEELGKLELLTNRQWVSEDVHPDGKTVLHHSREWKSGHQGRIIYITQKCEELGSLTEGYFYFNPESRRLELFTLTNNGNITTGTVTFEGNILKVCGTLILKDRKLEYMNTYEITQEGSLIDSYFRMENGEWKAGHSRVWQVANCPVAPEPGKCYHDILL